MRLSLIIYLKPRQSLGLTEEKLKSKKALPFFKMISSTQSLMIYIKPRQSLGLTKASA